MWFKISHIILRYRIVFVIMIMAITTVMAYLAQFAEMSYDFSSAVPLDDPEQVYYQKFKKTFGDDGTILGIGMRDSALYKVDNFDRLAEMSQQIAELEGVDQVLSLPQMRYLEKDTAQQRFLAKKIFEEIPEQASVLDSLLAFARDQMFYEGILFDPNSTATLLLISIDKEVLESSARQALVQRIQEIGGNFERDTKIDLHYAGLPFIRSIVTGQVGSELQMLLMLSGLVTSVILFLFFRSFIAVIFPLIIIGTVVVWCVGFLVIFGFKITILTGLLPPVLVVIGIPNCVYLINKYHQEFKVHQHKTRALSNIIRKIGVVAFLTNTTTAIGFAVFIFMDNINLKQFGIISSLCIFSLFIVSITMLPIFYSFLPAPTARQLSHLDRKPLNKLLHFFHTSVFHYRRVVYITVGVIAVLAVVGITQMRAISYMVDNIPKDSQPMKDIAFFDKHFNGLMPLEIVVNTKRKQGVMRLSTLRQVEKFEQSLEEVSLVSQPLSLVTLVKASKQAFYNNQPEFYELPTSRDRPFILAYLEGGQDSTSQQFLNTLVDSTGQRMRISLKVADVGSERLDSLINQVIRPKIDESFKDDRLAVDVTGITLIFLKGNDYLVSSLKSSLVLAIILVAILMALLFGSFRMIAISIFTNILPLAITAGLMGYFGVSLKPSTALIFSIAFGIAIDDSIHFLARYRQALLANPTSVPKAVEIGLRETGAGMVYTSIILFFGFIVFAYSDFDGTEALGYLTSVTLLCAMFANLILLPSLLITFDPGRYHHNKMLIAEYYHEGINELDDEEIDLSRIRVQKKENVEEEED